MSKTAPRNAFLFLALFLVAGCALLPMRRSVTVEASPAAPIPAAPTASAAP